MVADGTKQLTETNTGLEATKKRVEALGPALAAEQKKVADAKAALDQIIGCRCCSPAGRGSLDSGRSISTIGLQTFKTKTTEVENSKSRFLRAVPSWKEMQARVKTAQDAMAAAQKAEQVATAEATAAKTMQQVTAARDVEKKNLANREGAVAVLKEAMDKGGCGSGCCQR